MRFWFVHSSEVSLQEQIVTQVSLGILTRELEPGERLPSVRELARRFKIHPNTVSLAYRRLEDEGWVEARRGSGVYVRAAAAEGKLTAEGRPAEYVKGQIRQVIESAAVLGVHPAELREMFLEALERPKTRRMVVVEPDIRLREIVVAEIEEALGCGMEAMGLPTNNEVLFEGAVALVLPSKADAVRASLTKMGATQAHVKVLKVRSVPESLAAFLPAPKTALVAVVSGWPRFIDLGRTMLIAAGFDGEALVVRDLNETGAQDGLAGLRVDAVVCDAVTAKVLPKGLRAIVFRLIAEDTLVELLKMKEQQTGSMEE